MFGSSEKATCPDKFGSQDSESEWNNNDGRAGENKHENAEKNHSKTDYSND